MKAPKGKPVRSERKCHDTAIRDALTHAALYVAGVREAEDQPRFKHLCLAIEEALLDMRDNPMDWPWRETMAKQRCGR